MNGLIFAYTCNPFFISAVILCIWVFSAFADVHVRGYYRGNGTYVRSHYRSNPDRNFYNNWSTYPNVNPRTGAVGTKHTPSFSSSNQRGNRISIAPRYPVQSLVGPRVEPEVSMTQEKAMKQAKDQLQGGYANRERVIALAKQIFSREKYLRGMITCNGCLSKFRLPGRYYAKCPDCVKLCRAIFIWFGTDHFEDK